jgi:hypothetical protein
VVWVRKSSPLPTSCECESVPRPQVSSEWKCETDWHYGMTALHYLLVFCSKHQADNGQSTTHIVRPAHLVVLIFCHSHPSRDCRTSTPKFQHRPKPAPRRVSRCQFAQGQCGPEWKAFFRVRGLAAIARRRGKQQKIEGLFALRPRMPRQDVARHACGAENERHKV